jgi:hypothetical protein
MVFSAPAKAGLVREGLVVEHGHLDVLGRCARTGLRRARAVSSVRPTSRDRRPRSISTEEAR